MFDTTEAVNYARDPRNQGPADEDPSVMIDGEFQSLPTIWKVCPVCKGQGTHVDPAIDCCGLTAEDFAEDPDFQEDYFRGSYDVQCNHCRGRSTVREVDLARLTPTQREAWDQLLEQRRQDREEELSEIRMGA